ncbi:MAG TPA: DUF3570 domain-containing protein [Steroidobacteraceae bacterium]|nr:DUF3570 domain-containing protein [Steroidobacteraceae bacterium]
MADRDAKIGAALAAATCSLLGVAPSVSVAEEAEPKWDIDSAFLYYGESDGRVKDFSLSSHATRDFGDERKLGLDLSVDWLTGASPNGAIASDGAQTFTSPSGGKTYTTPAGEIPLDETFLDTRFALNASWTQPFARLYTVSAGLGFSSEYDYQHIGANIGLTRDFNQRNTTLSAAVAYAQDTIEPVGGLPLPLAQMPDAVGDDDDDEDDEDLNPANRGDSSDTKNVLDVLLGFTQVLGRHTVLRVNLSYSDSSGYLTDPYKILSVVDPVTGELIGRTPAPGESGPTGVYRFESRPDSRRKESVYAEMRHDFSGRVLQVGYRYSTDDWEVDSHTLESRLRLPFGGSNYLEPHVRYYQQTAASFYRYSLPNTSPLPGFATADARLSEMSAVTVGLKYGHVTAGGDEWNARLEFYRQTGKAPSEVLIGNQIGNTQMPDFDAVILQFGYRFKL